MRRQLTCACRTGTSSAGGAPYSTSSTIRSRPLNCTVSPARAPSIASKIGAIKKVPEKIIVEGPVVSKENAESVLFLQDDSILLA